jgi:ADP-ribosylglycohydrolase
MRTAGAVLYIISKFNKDPLKTLKEAILLGGDTDTVASICLGIVAMKTGIRKLPPFLFRDLENNGYGRDYLIEIGLTAGGNWE